ncbi:MAG: hypothetical protein ABI430_00515 [Candidatus Taylorbacteria bacterium]
MQIIEVIPISRGIGKETLTYFTSDDISLGAVIEVPLRKKIVPAIVISKNDASEHRTELRQAEFQLKKITKRKGHFFFLPEFMESANEAARYFAATTGSVLASLISARLLAELEKIKIEPQEPVLGEKIHQKYILQAGDEERFVNYKSFIRGEFAKKSSVFFCLPSVHDIKKTVGKLEKGIEEYTFVLHGSLSENELRSTLAKLTKEKHPVLILGTGSYLSYPRADLGAIIVDRENSSGYKTFSRPYLDFRVFAEMFAKKIKAKFVVGDIFIDIATLFRYKNGEFQELSPVKFRSLTSAEERMVDMRVYKASTKNFTLVSEELRNLIQANKTNNENLFIFAARKGLSPTTVCGDCGETITCNKCSANMVLHGSQKGNFFLCHRCGERRDPEEVCKVCQGWKLVTLGAGIDSVGEEIRALYGDVKIFIMDKDKVTTHGNAEKMMNQFFASPGSILLGTELALLYLDRPIENSAIASLDALFSLPDFRINEKIMSILLTLRSVTHKQIVIQTRNPDQKVFEYGMKGNLFEFYRDEIGKREQFNYPPFSILVKISLEGQKSEIVRKMSEAKATLSNYNIDIFPSFIKGLAGKSIMHGLLRVSPRTWPDSELLLKLTALSPEFTVKVDPESLL